MNDKKDNLSTIESILNGIGILECTELFGDDVTVRMFSDGSGMVVNEFGTPIIYFDSLIEADEKLTALSGIIHRNDIDLDVLTK